VLLATTTAEATFLWCEACGHIWKLAPATLTTH
jgi:DNA-directed RNA polymerase subunit M/transcription elongation factor TFIIS